MKKFGETFYNMSAKLARNIGFRLNKNSIYTYSQDKSGFKYFYYKREVLSESISTISLNFTLSPWNKEIEIVEHVQHPLSNLFPIELINEEISFRSSLSISKTL